MKAWGIIGRSGKTVAGICRLAYTYMRVNLNVCTYTVGGIVSGLRVLMRPPPPSFL